MIRIHNTLCLAVIWAGSFAVPAAAAETISVNAAVRYQTMTGWEATARGWEINKAANAYDPSYLQYAPAVAAKMVNELGINRLQLPLKTGWMNPVDYWTQFANGQLSYTQWNSHAYEKIGGAPYQFAEFDFNVETMLLPMRQQLQARGERLYVNMIGTDFNVPGMNGNFHFSQNPAAYAAFVKAYADRLQTKYGVTLDAFEVTLDKWNLGGELNLTTLASKVILPAGGSFSAKANLTTRQLTGDLNVPDFDTPVNFLGILPLTAKVGLLPAGTTGTPARSARSPTPGRPRSRRPRTLNGPSGKMPTTRPSSSARRAPRRAATSGRSRLRRIEPIRRCSSGCSGVARQTRGITRNAIGWGSATASTTPSR